MSLVSIINELTVENIQKSISFYVSNFEFQIEITDGNPITWVQLRKDKVIIMLENYSTVKDSINNYPSKVNSSNLIKFEYDHLEEIKELYILLKQNGIEFFMDYMETEFGKAEFGIFDPDKNMILISALI